MVCEVSRTHGNFYICYYDHPYLSTFKETDVFLGSSKFLCPPRCISDVVFVVVAASGYFTLTGDKAPPALHYIIKVVCIKN